MKFSAKDIAGVKSGKLIAMWPVGHNGKDRHILWACSCECGNYPLVYSSSIAKGTTKSCGCLIRETVIKQNTTHGHAKTGKMKSPEYRTWNAMMTRCTNPKSDNYSEYGGRGIFVCNQWFKFENFLLDMGPRPAGMTIERINNSQGYEPSNCVWATPKEQAANRRRPRKFSHVSPETKDRIQRLRLDGLKISDIALQLGLSRTSVSRHVAA